MKPGLLRVSQVTVTRALSSLSLLRVLLFYHPHTSSLLSDEYLPIWSKCHSRRNDQSRDHCLCLESRECPTTGHGYTKNRIDIYTQKRIFFSIHVRNRWYCIRTRVSNSFLYFKKILKTKCCKIPAPVVSLMKIFPL